MKPQYTPRGTPGLPAMSTPSNLTESQIGFARVVGHILAEVWQARQPSIAKQTPGKPENPVKPKFGLTEPKDGLK